MRAEEIILQAPDGRSVTTLINATPIFSEEGETWAKNPVRKIGRAGRSLMWAMPTCGRGANWRSRARAQAVNVTKREVEK